MTLQEIREKRWRGDYQLAAIMLGVSTENVKVSLKRPRAKRHPAALAAMAQVIRVREGLLQQTRQAQIAEAARRVIQAHEALLSEVKGHNHQSL